MRTLGPKRVKLSDRFNSRSPARTPLRQWARSLSKVAKYAIDEANSLSLERVPLRSARLPKKLDGFKIVHLSDTHHSPFTGLDHIARAVKIANRLKPDMFILTGDYVSHEPRYIAPVAEVLGELNAEFGTSRVSATMIIGPTPIWSHIFSAAKA